MASFRQHFLPPRQWLFVLLGALIFTSAGFYNNFPLVYPDSGAYIFNGFLGEVPWDRPLPYSLFFVLASFRDFPFSAIFIQGLLLSYLVFLHFRHFSDHRHWAYHFLAFTFLATLTTAVSYTSSRIMADIFTPLLLLGLSFLLLAKKQNRIDTIVVAAILAFSVSVHNSHLLIGGILLGLFSLLAIVRTLRKQAPVTSLRQLGLGWALLFAGVFITGATHWVYGGKFQLSKASEVFLMRQLIEFGIAEKYLDKYCGEKDYKLCAYKDELTGNFIWDANGAFQKMGGWGKNSAEFKAILKDAISKPKYFKMAVFNSIEYTFKQFFSFDVDDFHPEKKGSPTYAAIEFHYSSHIHKYQMAYQTRGKLTFDFLNQYQTMVVYLSFFLTFLLFLSPSLWQSIPESLRWLLLFLFVSLWVNAFVCGSLSAVVTRYQNRVVWLMPMAVWLVFSQRAVWATFVKKLSEP
jgi:hypothetical protein